MPTPVQHFEPLSLGQVSPMAYALSQLPSVVNQSMQQQRQMQQDQMQKALYAQRMQEEATKMKYLEPGLQADLAAKQADIRKNQQLANLPLGGLQLPGVAGQAMAIETLGQVFGKDSPQYLHAKHAFDLDQQSQNQNMLYQQALTKSMPERYLTPGGRGYLEEARVNQGQSPTGQSWGEVLGTTANSKDQPFSPEEIKNNYEMIRLKASTDPQARQKNLYARNIDKTLQSFKPEDLTQYSGIIGSIQRGLNSGLAPTGHETKNYDKYSKALSAIDLLASQVRQFYGDSVQSTSMDRIADMFKTGSWKSNPKLALETLNNNINNLKNEMGTYQSALQGTDIYKGNYNKSKVSKNADNDPLGIR